MKRLISLIATLFFMSGAIAQNGRVIESLEFQSKKVNYPVKYSVYFPPGYGSSDRSYPILYLLHGYSDDETGWTQFGEVNAVADMAIAAGDATPCIIVMPDAKVTWYSDSYDGKDLWETMFIEEFIPFVEEKYRVRDKKEFRAIAGLSMGGYGALKLAMRHTDLFSSCVAMSSGTFTDEEMMEDDQYDHLFGAIYGPRTEEGASEHWKANNPLYLIDSVDHEKLKSVRYYIDCGDDDFLYKGNATLHIKMRDHKIPHQYRVRDGGHKWNYWRTGLYDGLKFITEKFHR